MKYTLTLLLCCIFAFSAEAITHKKWQDVVAGSPALAGLNEATASLDNTEFLDLTPKKYREMTGKRLGIVGSIALKAAQKRLKKSNNREAVDLPQVAYVILSIFWLGWLAMGLLDDFQGDNWWIGLILYLLFYFPGLIFSLIKMGEYY